MSDREASETERRAAVLSRRRVVVALGVFFAVVLWGGYSHHWSWTGINSATATLWDWLHLLLLPLLLPTLVVPLMMPMAIRRLESVASAGTDGAEAEAAPPVSSAPATGPGLGAASASESRSPASG